jgi:WD40 repeat protein
MSRKSATEMTELSTSPYPGLRAFRSDESDIFFGREAQTDSLLERVQRSHFLAVVGPSGCGKSSLVRAGMIAALESGFMADAGSRWRIVEMRPGDRPISRLAEALSASHVSGSEHAGWAEEAAFFEAALRRGPLGLTEMLQETQPSVHANLLLLVDQFEEIFRFREKGDPDEADAFVDLLLATAQRRKARAYVVTTMRSDFLGDCTLFKGLPEAINRSQYLTPRLTRDQCRAAIVGPAKVFGGDLEPALVNRLLNDFGPDPDQLPLLQHALMRMWTRVTERLNGSGDCPSETLLAIPSKKVMLAVSDYDGLGGLSRALSDHADEVLKELTDPQRKVAEVMFRRLTERGIGKRDTRAPARLSDVAAVAGVSYAEVAAVVEAFRRPDRCFVTPPVGLTIGPETLLDIGHESLIRQWCQLSDWVEKEGRSALMYQRLKQTAQLWKNGDAALWRNPDLERHLQWERVQQPSAAWAIRYGSAEEFGLAMEFLRASERTWLEERRFQEESKVKAELQRSRMHRVRLIILGTASVFLFVIAAVFAFLSGYLKKQYDDISYYKQFTVLRPLYAAYTPGSADRNIIFACQLVKELSRQRMSTDPLLYGDAVSILDRALTRRGRLVNTYWNSQHPRLDEGAGQSPGVLSVAYSPDGRVLVVGDRQGRLRVLRDGSFSDPLNVSRDPIRSLAFSPDGSKVAVGTQGGSLFIFYPSAPPMAQKVVELVFSSGAKGTQPVWSCSWSAYGDLAAGCQDGKIYVWFDLPRSLQSENLQPSTSFENIVGNTAVQVHAVAWNHAGSKLAIGDGRGNVRLWDKTHLTEPVRAHSDTVWNLAWSRDERLACGSWDRTISVWRMADPSSGGAPTCLCRRDSAHDGWVRDVAWIDNDHKIASVGTDGMLRFWNSSDLTDAGSEQSPTTELWKLSYSETKETIATANNDGAVRIYQLNPGKQQAYGRQSNDIMRFAFMDSSVLSFDLDGLVSRFDTVSQKVEEPVQIPLGFREGIHAVQFHPATKAFVIGYDFSFAKEKQQGGQLVVWDPLSGSAPRGRFIEEPIRSLSCNPRDSTVAFVSGQGTLGLRTLPDLEPIPSQHDLHVGKPGASVGRISWSNAGDVLAITLNQDADKRAEILRFRYDGKKLIPIDPEHPIQIPASVFSFAWHPDDRVMAMGTVGGAVLVYDFDAGLEESAVAHDGRVHTLSWSNDGRRLFTGGDDGSLRVWDCDSAQNNKLTLTITLRQDTGAIHAVGVAPDGEGVYTGGTNPKIFYWPKTRYSVDEILSRAENMVHRNMVRSEWVRYTEKDPDRGQRYEKTFEGLPALFEAELP